MAEAVLKEKMKVLCVSPFFFYWSSTMSQRKAYYTGLFLALKLGTV